MSTIKVRYIGYPVLCAISDKEEDKLFLVVLRRGVQMPNGEINVLMTDDCKDIVIITIIYVHTNYHNYYASQHCLDPMLVAKFIRV